MTYIDHKLQGRGDITIHSWRDHTRANLAWHYGEQLADEIMAGQDLETQADVSAWDRLGASDRQAAE